MRTLQSQAGWWARAQWVLGTSMVTLCAAFYLFGYRPSTARMAELRAQIDMKARELESNQRENSVRPRLESEDARMKFRLALFHKQQTKQDEWGQILNEITLLCEYTPLCDYYNVLSR